MTLTLTLYPQNDNNSYICYESKDQIWTFQDRLFFSYKIRWYTQMHIGQYMLSSK